MPHIMSSFGGFDASASGVIRQEATILVVLTPGLAEVARKVVVLPWGAFTNGTLQQQLLIESGRD